MLASAHSSRLFNMMCRYLVYPNAPHKAFVARQLTVLLAAHRAMPGSPLRVDSSEEAKGDESEPRAPSWPLEHLMVLHQSMIQRVHSFKLKLGVQAASPFFRALLNIGVMAEPVVRLRQQVCALGGWVSVLCTVPATAPRLAVL